MQSSDLFIDRRDAGRRLAERLASLASERPIVVALPRGGVPVAREVSDALQAPLDVLVVRKLGAPGNAELGVGAIAEGGGVVIDGSMVRRVGMTTQALEATIASERREVQRRVDRYRSGRAPADARGRTVILVDDGLATGVTMLAAVRGLREAGASRIVVAVPVGAAESVALVGKEADEVVCHTIPGRLVAVGYWYRDFAPVEDEEVVSLLACSSGAAAAAPSPPGGPSADAPG